mmetsp:Transcript_31770/g.47224  ORF Transcript_31770/g.47224 Transcript_31770/m.47224 type:complete len:270 (-) Transcript_31770:132-941(-)
MSSSTNEQLKATLAKTGTQISNGLVAFRSRPRVKAAASSLTETASQLRSGISQIGQREELQAAKATISEKASVIGSSVTSSISTMRANPDVQAVKQSATQIGSSVSSSVQSLSTRVQQMDIFASLKQEEEDDAAERRRQQEADENAARAAVIRESQEACLRHMQADLVGFLEKTPDGTYEQWIESYHPENAFEGSLLPGLSKTIDHRFYVKESDHRKLWNDNVPDRIVPARTHMFADNEDQVPTDLLGGDIPKVDTQEETIEFDDPWST